MGDLVYDIPSHTIKNMVARYARANRYMRPTGVHYQFSLDRKYFLLVYSSLLFYTYYLLLTLKSPRTKPGKNDDETWKYKILVAKCSRTCSHT